ncbi:MAG: hypothetical protein ACREIL_09850 [Nitrospiraceae bacterium]
MSGWVALTNEELAESRIFFRRELAKAIQLAQFRYPPVHLAEAIVELADDITQALAALETAERAGR